MPRKRDPFYEGMIRQRRSSLYYLPLDDSYLFEPKEGETLDALERKLKRLARSYRGEYRAYRIERRANGVLCSRVPPGKHIKLAPWYSLEPGQSVLLMREASASDLRAAKQTADYLRRKGAGSFSPRLDDDTLTVTRHS